MMWRGLGAAVLAAGLAIPAAAQQKDMAASPEMRQQAEAIAMKWMDAVNNGDAQGWASQFSATPVDITPYGVTTSAAQIGEVIQKVHKLGLHLSVNVEDVQPLFGGQGLMSRGTYSAKYTANPATSEVKGNWLQVLEREDGAWKIRATSVTRLAQPSAAVAKGATGAAPMSGTSTPPGSK